MKKSNEPLPDNPDTTDNFESESQPEEMLPDTEQSLFETARRLEKKQREEAAEREQKIKRIEEKQREEYAKKLHQERVDMMRRKQGLEPEFPENDAKPEPEKKYTFSQKVSNFFYHNKWWLGLGTFCTLIVGFLIYDLATKVTPDVTILLMSYNSGLTARTSQLADIFEQYAEDSNGDGKVSVQIIYVPCSEEYDATQSLDATVSSSITLTAELQGGTSAIFISDAAADKKSEIDSAVDPKYGKTYLKDTKLAEMLGLDYELKDDLYISMRTPVPEAGYADTLLDSIDAATPALTGFINAISK